MSRLKAPVTNSGSRVTAPPEFSDLPEQRPPEFSFRYVQTRHCISLCERDEKAALVDKLHTLSSLTWAQIKQQNRHKLGFEKLSRNTIRAPIPGHVTPEVDLIAFRFSGMKPMVGYRREATFFILWLDRDFTLYDHG
ncbi:hypothetical protein ACQUFY_12895 [Robbsia andropogonis]|uniref:hypothetical protein n=1 Tax=Robbsia andropogonis TaxID=28092 RepID=UPI003D1D3CB1